MRPLVLLILAGCLASLPLQAQDSAPAEPSEGTSGRVAASNYVIKALDLLRITVFQEPDLNKEIRVSADGQITLDFIGPVRVAGQTVKDAQTLITQLYNQDYLVNPQITLQVLSYTERRVHVHGQVNRPGPVIIPPEESMTLAQAISMAGGLTRLGRASSVSIKRTDASTGESKVIQVDFDEILRNPRSNDLVLKEGDVIFVPESPI